MIENINLPSKDSNGVPFTSYSQISCFLKSKHDFINTYILKKPFVSSKYIDYGLKIDRAICYGKTDGLSNEEIDIVKSIKKYEHFQRQVNLKYDNFYIKGFIDTIDDVLLNLIDYKTGLKSSKYKQQSYFQLQLYALALMQETGIKPESAMVLHIKTKLLSGRVVIDCNKAEEIPVDISIENLREVYWSTLDVVKSMSRFYNRYISGMAAVDAIDITGSPRPQSHD